MASSRKSDGISQSKKPTTIAALERGLETTEIEE